MKYSSAVDSPEGMVLPDNFGRALTYWRDLCAGRSLPAWRDVDMMALPLDLVPWCSVVDVHDAGEDFSVRFFGTERVRLHGSDYSAKLMSASGAPREMLDKVFGECRQTIAARGPLLFKTDLIGDDDETASYRVLRLPFADDAQHSVDAILSMLEVPAVPKVLYDWFGTEPPVNLGFSDNSL